MLAARALLCGPFAAGLGRQPATNADSPPPMRVPRLPPHRWWVAAAAGVLVVGLGARLAAHGVTRPVLATDALALLAGAAVVCAGVRRAQDLSARARHWHGLLAAVFVLGAVRAALWAAGLPVEWANLAALAAALVALAAWAVRRRRERGAGPLAG